MKATRTLLVLSLLGAVSVPAALADDHPADKLGTIRFEVAGKPDAQREVIRGVKLLHHMMYPEADRAFAQAAATDPACALAYWGRAMSLIHPLWPDAPTDAERRQGADYIRRGLACPAVTSRETGYHTTLDRYFGAAAAGDHVTRLKDLDKAWAELAQQFPADLDVLAFSALYHLAPARFATKDRSHRLQLEAVALLQTVAAEIPEHPGAQHYKIHAFDFPMLADRALEVCESYSSIAPDVPHALHMPTHIFTRRGRWEQSIDFNLRSAQAARKLGLAGGAINGHLPHALDYLAYAYLQRGQYRAAEAIRRQVLELNGPYSAVNPTATAFAFAAIPARLALERQAWSEAAGLPLHQPAAFAWGPPYLNCDSIVRFARAIGAARSGKIDAAQEEVAELERVHQALSMSQKASYWTAQAETQLLAARAWVTLAAKNTDEAIALMRRAAAIEATADKEAVTPGEVLPAGDLLGDMLLETGRPAEALAAFEAVLGASPNRLNTLYGAGLAAERGGNKAAAREYFGLVLKVAVDSDAGINRVEHARAFVAQ